MRNKLIIEDEFEYQIFLGESAQKIEKSLRGDIEDNFNIILQFEKKYNPKFQPRKYKKNLMRQIELFFADDDPNMTAKLEIFIKQLQVEAYENNTWTNYIIINLYIYRHLIWCLYEHGFQPSLTWEIYRSLKLTESFRARFKDILDNVEKERKKMSELAKKRHEATRLKDLETEKKLSEIWRGSNWKSYTDCANHVHKNNLVNEDNYRKIFNLISKVAKQKS